MYNISKEFHWSASHQLSDLPDGHPCTRLHGHNYIARVNVQAHTVDAAGFVVDFGDLAGVGKVIDEQFDHQHLNDRVIFNPTAENLAAYLVRLTLNKLGKLDQLKGRTIRVRVEVCETPKCWASFTGEWETL